jgi:hypothetical protein
MSSEATVTLTRLILDSVHVSTHARKEIDLFLLSASAELARRSPSPSLLHPLAKVDPLCTRTWGTQKTIMGAVLSIGASIAKAHPKEAARVHAVVGPFLDHKIPAEKEDVDAYLGAVKITANAPLSPIEVELAIGETKYLPGGLRVALLEKDARPSFSIFTRFDIGQSEKLEPRGRWFREGYSEPWRWDMSRIGAEDAPTKVRVTLTPVPTKPEQKRDPELFDLARAAAKQAGCPTYERHQFESWNGIFILHASGEKQTCAVTLGGWSGRLLDLTAVDR